MQKCYSYQVTNELQQHSIISITSLFGSTWIKKMIPTNCTNPRLHLSQITSQSTVWWGNHRSTVYSPHKGSLMREWSPYHDVHIMNSHMPLKRRRPWWEFVCVLDVVYLMHMSFTNVISSSVYTVTSFVDVLWLYDIFPATLAKYMHYSRNFSGELYHTVSNITVDRLEDKCNLHIKNIF